MKRNIIIATLSLFLCATTAQQAGAFDLKKIFGKMTSLVGGGKNGSDYQNPKVMGQALALLIFEKSTQADTIAKEISARFPKDAAMQTEIARAYFRNNSRETTRIYLNKAMAADTSFAAAYELKGLSFGRFDQEKKEYVLFPEDADSACYWFNKAIAADPTQASAYISYADAQTWNNVADGAAKLEELRKACPDYNVDMALADFYKKASERARDADLIGQYRDQSNKHAESVDPYKMSHNQLSEFAVNAYLDQKYDRSMELSLIGLKRFPAKKDYHRVVAWSAASLGKYQDAMEHAAQFIELTPKDSVWSIDYWALGTGYLGKNKLDEAYAEFERIKSMDDRFSGSIPSWIYATVNDITKKMKEQGLYDDAADFFIRYNTEFPSATDPAMRLYYISQIFMDEQKELEGELKQAALRKVFKYYQQIEEEYPEWTNVDYIMYNHAHYLWAIFDPKYETLEPEPYYKKLYDHVAASGKTGQQEMVYMEEAARYLMLTSYFQHKDVKATNMWAKRLMEVSDDPEVLSTAATFAKIKTAK